MFLAVIIPEARRNFVILGVIAVSFALSLGASLIPVVSKIPEGTRIIILTVAVSALAALLFPIKEEAVNE